MERKAGRDGQKQKFRQVSENKYANKLRILFQHVQTLRLITKARNNSINPPNWNHERSVVSLDRVSLSSQPT